MSKGSDRKIAIVTGAASGIGRAISLRLSRDGAVTNLVDINVKAMDELVRQISDRGGSASAENADVSKFDEVAHAVENIVKKHGRIDILVNNAGVYPGKPFLELTDEDWDKVFNINVKGVFHCTKAVAPFMIKQSGGCIVNMSSDQAYAPKAVGLAHYAASKAAVRTLTRGLAVELGKFGIRVNDVAPGMIPDTPGFKSQHPDLEKVKKGYLESHAWIRRTSTTDEVASAVAFLVSDDASFVNGSTLVVNGGREFL